MGIAIVDAVKLAQSNKRTAEELADRERSFRCRTADESAAQEKARTALYTEGLVPFRELFGRLKNVDLAELEAADELPSGELAHGHVRPVRVSVVQSVGAVAGSAVVGAGAGAATFAAVGAFATASTGAAISGLSGAAATSATLAWLGGGSIAAGGGGVAAGTTVLAGIVAAPVVVALGGVLEWQGRRARRGQVEAAEALAQATTEFDEVERTGAAVRRLSRQVRDVLADLQRALTVRLPLFEALLNDNGTDYAAFTTAQRRSVADVVGIATSAVTVMSVRVTEDDATPSTACRQVVLETKQRLNNLPPVR